MDFRDCPGRGHPGPEHSHSYRITMQTVLGSHVDGSGPVHRRPGHPETHFIYTRNCKPASQVRAGPGPSRPGIQFNDGFGVGWYHF